MGLSDFVGSDVGGVILQAAQGIVAQVQGQQQLALRQRQLDEEAGRQARVLDLQQKELDIRERTVAVQEQQLTAKQTGNTLDAMKTVAETQNLQARTAQTLKETSLLRPKGGGGGDVPKQFLLEQGNAAVARTKLASLAQQWNQANPALALPAGDFTPSDLMRVGRALEASVAEFYASSGGAAALADPKFVPPHIRVAETRAKAIQSFSSQPDVMRLALDSANLQMPQQEVRAALDVILPGAGSLLGGQDLETETMLQGDLFGSEKINDVLNAVRLAGEGGNATLLRNILSRSVVGPDGRPDLDRAARAMHYLETYFDAPRVNEIMGPVMQALTGTD